MINKGLFSSASQHWSTPVGLYVALNREFSFNYDPCPLNPTTDGLIVPWGSRSYCNPPYGREIGKWLAKAYEENQKGKLVVCLIPSRTDTKWWHEYVMRANEIRFLRGRLKFDDSKNSAPFPSAIVIFKRASPKDKPPLLSTNEIKKLGWGWMLNYDYELNDVLQAQRESDIKYLT